MKHVFYDVTSFSTWSRQISTASYGYNRDGEDLAQINVGLFCSECNSLPLYICSYDGSLNDASNFSYVLRQARDCALKASKRSLKIIMDGGFSSSCFNWAHMEGYGLIAGVSAMRYQKVKEAYLKWSSALVIGDASNAFGVNDDLYISSRVPMTLGGVEGELVMYRDLNSQNSRTADIIRCRNQKRDELESYKHWPGKDFDSFAKAYAPFFIVTRSKNSRGFTYEENTQAVKDALALCGKVTLFTTCKGMSDKELIEAYRAKESVEDCFDTTKNGLSDKRLDIHGDAQAEGKLFALFLALILWRTIHIRCLNWQKQYNLTVSDAIRELKKIHFYKSGNSWCMKDAITKRQRELLEDLKLDLSFMGKLKDEK